VLTDAAAIARSIRPGTRLLPEASRRLANAVETTTPVLSRLPGVLGPLRTTLAAFESAAGEARSSGALNGLLATVASLGDTLRVLTPPQVYCNVGGLWARNLPNVLSVGDSVGTWLTAVLVTQVGQMLQSPQPDPSLHATPYPNENANECEAGNEPFAPGQFIGNPAGNQSRTTEPTSPPPGALDRARAAGLILNGGTP
jgi:phospholipid/cholesterol/gamma-HCH transport system substrate-binding protein